MRESGGSNEGELMAGSGPDGESATAATGFLDAPLTLPVAAAVAAAAAASAASMAAACFKLCRGLGERRDATVALGQREQFHELRDGRAPRFCVCGSTAELNEPRLP